MKHLGGMLILFSQRMCSVLKQEDFRSIIGKLNQTKMFTYILLQHTYTYDERVILV